MIHNRDLQLNDSSQLTASGSCISLKPPPIEESNGQLRDATWGGAFDMDEANEAADYVCDNLTNTPNPVILSLAIGGRPFYEYSINIAATETANAINFVATVREGCQIALTSDYCHQRINQIINFCPTWEDNSGLNWTLGGSVVDPCGEFYMVAGTKLTGDLWVSPLTDMNPYLWA
jgi:hypothetical protein